MRSGSRLPRASSSLIPGTGIRTTLIGHSHANTSQRSAACRATVVGVYSAVIHYLRAVEALGNHADGKAVIAKIKELPTEDRLMGKGYVRIDGRKIHPMYLFEVKKPEESKAPWDYYKQLATIPAEEAWRPLDQSECPLVKK